MAEPADSDDDRLESFIGRLAVIDRAIVTESEGFGSILGR